MKRYLVAAAAALAPLAGPAAACEATAGSAPSRAAVEDGVVPAQFLRRGHATIQCRNDQVERCHPDGVCVCGSFLRSEGN